MLVSHSPASISAEEEVIEAKGSKLEFHARFQESEIEWGKAPFDETSGNGMDKSPRDPIVRTFDSATYNLNITANPTIEGSVDNVVIRVWGELDGAVADDGRVNAVFSERAPGEVYTVLHPEEHAEYDEPVSGVDFTYTLDRVGEAVSLPIDISVQGAHDGAHIVPQLQIQVVEIDGEDVTNEDIRVDLRDELPGFDVTGRVSFKARTRPVVGGALSQTTARGALDDPDEKGWYRTIGSDFILDSLPERNSKDMRGATFPSGTIHFEYELYGLVDWWDDPEASGRSRRDPIVYSEAGDQTEIAHYADIDGKQRKTFNGGAEGLRWEDETFNVVNFGNYNTGQSRLPDFKQSTIESRYTNSVWDSGDWRVDPHYIDTRKSPLGFNEQEVVVHPATVSDYVIGYTFPTRRANSPTAWWLPAGERTIYDGLNMDKGTYGGLTGGMGAPIFATQTHVMYMPNSYRHGTNMNPNEINNEERHQFRIRVLGYENEEGEFVSSEKVSDTTSTMLDNRGGGTVSINQTFRGSTMKEENGQLINPMSNFKIANERSGHSHVTTGDAQLIQGNNAYVLAYLRTNSPSIGGVDYIQRWNIDSFKVTPLLAEFLEKYVVSHGYHGIDGWIVNGEAASEHMETLWGVQKFTDNSFESFMGRSKEEYEWFDDFNEAEKHGAVGARMIRVTDGISSGYTIVTKGANLPLFVHDQTLGSVNQKGTPHIVTTEGHVYFSGRDNPPTISNNNRFNWNDENRTYTTYSEDYTIDRLQSPIGSNVPLATLGIVPGNASGTLRSEKSSMYSNETTSWTGTATLAVPEHYGDEAGELDPYMTVEHTLPEGLRYVAGSGKVGEQVVDPTATIHDDGTQTLLWRIRLDEYRSAAFTFETSVNPFGLSGNSSSERLEISQHVSHELDQDMNSKRVATRTSKDGVNILRIGLVGVHGELNPTNGSSNENYTYYLRPYTTMQDEHGVRGVFTLPYDGDPLGSEFHGSLEIDEININGRDDINIWVHKDSLQINRPDKVDLEDGWEEWNGQSNVGTIYYEIEEHITAQDNIEIAINLRPEGNRIGDSYVHQSNVNSKQGYLVSPVTERERFRITPDGEVGLEYIRIDTNNASDELIAEVGFSSLVYREKAESESFAIELHEIDSEGESLGRVASWNTSFEEMSSSNDSIELSIAPDYLDVNQSKRYEARIASYNPERIQIFDEAGRIDTLGYTSSELDIEFDVRDYDESSTDDLSYENVVRTERYLGQEMKEYNESWTVYPAPLEDLKSGYGLDWSLDLVYRNELGHIDEEIEGELFVEEQALDGNFEVVEKDERSFKQIYLEHAAPEESVDKVGTVDDEFSFRQRFILPKTYVEDETGHIYIDKERIEQEQENEEKNLHEGGRKLFVPIWLPELGTYDVLFATNTSDERLGVNDIHIDVWSDFDVTAYMFGHIDSETIEEDEIIISPVDPSEPNVPSYFIQEDIDWLSQHEAESNTESESN